MVPLKKALEKDALEKLQFIIMQLLKKIAGARKTQEERSASLMVSLLKSMSVECLWLLSSSIFFFTGVDEKCFYQPFGFL